MLGETAEVEAAAFHDLVGNEHDVPKHREQMVLQAADHLAVDERGRRRILDLQLDPPRLR